MVSKWQACGWPAAPQASLPALPLGLASAALRYRQAPGRSGCNAARTAHPPLSPKLRPMRRERRCRACGEPRQFWLMSWKRVGAGRTARQPRLRARPPSRSGEACTRDGDPAEPAHLSGGCPGHRRCQATVLVAIVAAILVAVLVTILATIVVAVAAVIARLQCLILGLAVTDAAILPSVPMLSGPCRKPRRFMPRSVCR